MRGVWLSEPEPAAKRLDRARTLLGERSTPPASRAELQQGLSALRRAAVANLPNLVDQANSAWKAAGLHVHFASSATEGAAIVRGIAGATRYVAVNRSAAASKELAPELRAAGFAVSETYYQHLANAQVPARAFWQLPALNDADVLGCFARPRGLLEARSGQPAQSGRDVVGILGVAAGAADDGSLYLLQHLQNASELFASACQIVLLVALEKLVPTAADALLQTRATALFGAEATLLDLAPARQTGAIDASRFGIPLESLPSTTLSEEVHVILLDNGRRKMLGGTYSDLLACIGCRACAVKCPTCHEYAGPERWSPRDYLFYHLQGRNPSVDLCVGCTMCLAQCPIGIDVPAMMVHAKASRPGRIGKRLLGNFETVARISRAAPALGNAALGNHALRRLVEPVLGIKAERTLPRFAGETFAAWFNRRQARRGKSRVAYYAGCTANYVTPAIGKATVALFEKAGLEVCYPDQVCCGIPHMGNGLLKSARAHARHNVDTLLAADCDVVTACTSCALALGREYEHVLGVAGAAELAARTYDVMEYAARLRADERLPAAGVTANALTPPQRLLLYHAPCHLQVRGGRLVQDRVTMLGDLPGVSAKLIDRGCCGMAGTFGSRCSGYALSMTIGAPVFDAIREARADEIATDCPTCSLQLEQGTGMRPAHPVVLLAQAYGLEGGE